MARKSNKNVIDPIISKAKARFERSWQFERKQRAEELDDLKFRAGEQWPESVRSAREAAGRPVITVNLMGRFIRQVTGDIRINKPSIKVRPASAGASKEIAKVFTGVIRHIEQNSDAQNAYITAADSSATCGIGHFRISTKFNDDDTFEQDIVFDRILNPFSVYWDPAVQKMDRSDAKYCFVTSRMPLEDFKSKYPKAVATNFDGSREALDDFNWWDGETVRIAEYWIKEPISKKIALLEGGEVVCIDDIDEKVLGKLGIVRVRIAESHKIIRYVMNGSEVLSGPGDWAGKHIPIISVIGEEIFIGDRIVRHGLVRFAKDPQRLYNYSRTMMAEASALAPKAPWLLTPAQIEGQKTLWESANRGNPPYLLYNPDPLPNVPPPQRVSPAQVSTAQLQETIMSSQDMKGVTGIEDASLGAKGNETSGRAIALRQREGDTGTFVYIDNLSKAIRWAGIILVDLIPKIYDTERVLRILGEDGREEFVPINVEVPGENGQVELLNDISMGKYDVEVITGPSYSTKRLEASESMMAFIESVPNAAALISDLIAKNMDWPGAEEIAERLKKALPPGIAEEDLGDLTEEEVLAKKESDQAQQDKRDQEEQLVLAQAMGLLEELKAKISKMEAETADKIAHTDMLEVDTAQKAIEIAVANGQFQQLIQQAAEQAVLEALSN